MLKWFEQLNFFVKLKNFGIILLIRLMRFSIYFTQILIKYKKFMSNSSLFIAKITFILFKFSNENIVFIKISIRLCIQKFPNIIFIYIKKIMLYLGGICFFRFLFLFQNVYNLCNKYKFIFATITCFLFCFIKQIIIKSCWRMMWANVYNNFNYTFCFKFLYH